MSEARGRLAEVCTRRPESGGLDTFLQVRDGLRAPAFRRCLQFDVGAQVRDLSEREAWALHQEAMERFWNEGGTLSTPKPFCSLLDLKEELARRSLEKCRLCPWECEADRAWGAKGPCGVGDVSYFAHDFLHLGEQPDLVPAHTFFLGGCTMRCLYCRKWQVIENPEAGFRLLDRFSARVEQAVREGARSLKWLGGTPEPHLPDILAALGSLRVNLPVMWESTMYISREGLALAEGTVDLFLANLRYGSDRCALALSGVTGYLRASRQATLAAAAHTAVLIRHLVLPGHLDCCTRPVLEWAAAHFPAERVELLLQYVPHYQAFAHPELAIHRRLSTAERERARALYEEVFA